MLTHPCFIRKNTPELRRKLEDLEIGIHYTQEKYKEDNTGYIFCNRGTYSIYGPIGYTEELENAIDCGENETLFLAIAALRDDSDYMQWFTDGEQWILWDLPEFDGVDSCLTFGMYREDEIPPHKALVEELIEHFKQ